MRVERPFAYCCAEGGGRVEACDCVNKDHGTAWSDAPRNSVNALLVPRDVLARIRTSMCMLQQNSEGCATNHYGGDHELFGVPGWLADTRRDVDALTAILALTPVEGVGEDRLEAAARVIDPAAFDDDVVSYRNDEHREQCQWDAVEKARTILSTPVAQGDEVRDALAEASGWMQGNHDEGCALDAEYGSGGGKCTCGLDEAMARVNAALATLTKGARDAG